ncbi:TIGR04013 family B12-binding domain/radical SAM domain-containing protein [Methanotorris formicicus]|uniref:Radical SAM domain protein n=1 Tax=Methanotorris formicicus Mc-S-70 TaxID=647171 RepID=H1KZ47_9EURY|nr:TIGR04013 family B12-binding domain/radical SAM domain-containing protein [Methanotorris formicicus]EHP86472.1 Radical SAM domain protein [Methanotorris formicicus Mc-S-70]
MCPISNTNRHFNIGFRLTSKNRYSISKLYPLIGGILFKNFNELINNIEHLDVLIYSFMTMQRDNVLEEINKIIQTKKEKELENPILIAGGPHPSGNPKDTINMGFDYVIVGEGEITLPRLINKLKKEKVEERIIIGERVRNLDEYNKIYPMTPIEITRGCPFNCRFCQTPQIFGKDVRHRSIENIVKLVKNMGDLRFITPNAFCYGSKNGLKPNIEKLEHLLRELSKIKRRLFFGTFPSEVRPEFIKKETIELVVKYCDNKYLHFGAQSGSDEMLKYIRRGHTVDDVLNAIDLCVEYNLIPKVDFIFGFPNENEFHRKESIELIKYIIKKNGKVHAHYFMPLPGTYFENSSPTLLDKETLKILGKLSQKGLISGSWGYQYMKC